MKNEPNFKGNFRFGPEPITLNRPKPRETERSQFQGNPGKLAAQLYSKLLPLGFSWMRLSSRWNAANMLFHLRRTSSVGLYQGTAEPCRSKTSIDGFSRCWLRQRRG